MQVCSLQSHAHSIIITETTKMDLGKQFIILQNLKDIIKRNNLKEKIGNVAPDRIHPTY